ncbi:hypothetical protein B1L04_19845 [Microcystis aeruginosa KW]|uniref:Uncharacterized protein n=1 Tax=Microcystis aeruginosa KW TaxID=1960155 RepID=A0A1V4BUB8_MICAE|nr:hypothetical protein [Microcystis aeruginosa]OPF18073.1 hypothetical protein B1L04_19845 [Microcystis aeruginosa KW]
MEPVSLIVTALTAGAVAAAKDTAEKGVKDTYQGLKTLIKRKFTNDALAQATDRGTSKLKSLCSIKYRHRLQKKISHIYHI